MTAFTVFSDVLNLVIPLIMIVTGLRFKKYPPENINMLYGYRTKQSMKSNKAWIFAHQKCAKIWVVVGFVMLLITLGFLVICESTGAVKFDFLSVWPMILQCVVFFLTFIPVEIALKNKFDCNGDLR